MNKKTLCFQFFFQTLLLYTWCKQNPTQTLTGIAIVSCIGRFFVLFRVRKLHHEVYERLFGWKKRITQLRNGKKTEPGSLSIWMFPKIWEKPQIIHFNSVFHYKPSILGYPYFWKHQFLPRKKNKQYLLYLAKWNNISPT